MAQAVTERAYQGRVHEGSRRLMTEWMGELGRAEAAGQVTGALMISGNCVELLRACHVLPMFPEVTALQNAIRHKSLPLILKAEQIGYSSDNCAYVKADVGLVLEGGFGPGKALPFPNLIVCNYVGCNVYVKWFEHLADVSGSKLFMLDVPFLRTDAPSPADVAYVVRQLEELIALAESMTGRRFDIDELRGILAESARAQEGYARCKHLTKHRPAPFDAYFDSINMMGPINVLRGTREAAEFFDDATVVGVTAGASAPEDLVRSVIARLDPVDGIEPVYVTDEDEYFPPPRELRELVPALDGVAALLLGGDPERARALAGAFAQDRSVDASDALAGLST